METVLKLLRKEITGSPQDLSVGTEYKAYMRGVKAELKVRRQIAQGMIRSAFE